MVLKCALSVRVSFRVYPFGLRQCVGVTVSLFLYQPSLNILGFACACALSHYDMEGTTTPARPANPPNLYDTYNICYLEGRLLTKTSRRHSHVCV
jgi:hypothetical protein